jgi:DNA-binding Lrp family transcriptional regulator
MKTDTDIQIIEYIKKNGHTGVTALAKALGISPQAIHRQLNKLLSQNRIHKIGTPPQVFYVLAAKADVLEKKTDP